METETETEHPITIELDTPNGPRVEYGAQDAETVEDTLPAGYSVDWSNAIKIRTGVYRAPLVRV